MEELRQAKNHIDAAIEILTKEQEEKPQHENASQTLRSQMKAFKGTPLSYLQYGPGGKKFKITIENWE